MQKQSNHIGYPSGNQSQKGGGDFPPKKEESALAGLPEHVRDWFNDLQNFDILFCSLKSKTVVYQFVKHRFCLKCKTKISCFLQNKENLETRREIRDILLNDLYGISNDLVCVEKKHGKDLYDLIKFRLNDLEAVIACESEFNGDQEVLQEAQSKKTRYTMIIYSLVSQLPELPKEET